MMVETLALTPVLSPGERLHELPTLAERTPALERGCVADQPQRSEDLLRLASGTAALRDGFVGREQLWRIT